MIADIIARCISQDLRERQQVLVEVGETSVLPVGSNVPIELGPQTFIDNVERIGDEVTIAPDVQLGKIAKIGAGVNIGAGVIIGRGAIIENRVDIQDNAEVGELARLHTGVDLGEEVIVGERAEVAYDCIVPAGTKIPPNEQYFQTHFSSK